MSFFSEICYFIIEEKKAGQALLSPLQASVKVASHSKNKGRPTYQQMQ